MAQAGVDVIELGVSLQRSAGGWPHHPASFERALKMARPVSRVIALVREIRKSNSPANEVPIVLFSYYNPVFQMGLEKFAAAASGRRSRRCAHH